MTSESNFSDLSWFVLNRYFKENKNTFVVKHLIDTYNDFVFQKVEQIIEGFNTIDMYHQYIPEIDDFQYTMKIRVINPVLSKPMIHEKDGSTKIMTPSDARARNFTYAGAIHVDIDILVRTYDLDTKEFTTQNKKISGLSIGKLPIMVRSNYCVLNTMPQKGIDMGECQYDYGGYFIVNGNEKVVISQDRIAENKTYVFLNSKVTTYSLTAEIRSVQDNVFSVPKITSIKLSSKANQYGRYVKVNIHHIKHDIPIFVLFRALGVESDKSIMDHICLGCAEDPENRDIVKELVGSADDGNFVTTQKEAHDYMLRYLNANGHPKEFISNRQYKLNLLQNVLRNEFLPHVGTDYNKKALYIGYMVNKMIRCYLKKIPLDDRDSYINKRVDTPGVLMANLFRQYYGKLVKDMRNMVQKEINNGSWKATKNFANVINKVNTNKVFKSTIIESGIKYGLATGNWGVKSNKTKQGVAQVLNRMTYNATISHLRRINTPIEKSGKLVQPRKLHATQWGVVCPCETPEGASVGLVKNLAMMAYVTSVSCSLNVRDHLASFGVVITSDPCAMSGNTIVIVNGDIVGYHDKPSDLVQELRTLKMRGGINLYTSIFWKHNAKEIYVCTEGGRCVRPLFTVTRNRANVHDIADDLLHKRMTWNEMLLSGAIEYIDVEEANAAMIAMTYDDLQAGPRKNIEYTHMEMHPSLILGVLAGSIPFSDHNQAPRNTYQCLWEEEPVLMADGSTKKIKDVCIGDRVITFDPQTMTPSYTTVVNQYVRPTDKAIVKVKTDTGREIVVTEDHPFMTNKGWLPASRLMEGGVRVGVYIHPISVEDNNQQPFDRESLDEIKDGDALTLARVLGFHMAGGSPIHVTDSDRLASDAMAMRPYQKVWNTYSSGATRSIPEWIGNHMGCAREFVAAFHGARMDDTGYVKMNDPYFDNDVVKLLQHGLGIDVIHHSEGYRVDDIDEYMDKVGFRYNMGATESHALKAEYAKYCKCCEEDDDPVGYVAWIEATKVTQYSQFQKVASITTMENCMIADITTESENHSFVGGRGGFMVHNSAMGKQAIGLYSTNYQNRYDSVGHVLNYPQKPLVYTRASKIVNIDEMPCGINVIVAIATYTGFNQEDSLIMNKSSIDRGMFQSTVYRTYKDQNNKNHSTGEEEIYCNPVTSGVKQPKPYNYSKLSENGFVRENTCVNGNDIIIGKCMPQKVNGAIVNKDMSISLKNNEECFVDRNCVDNKYFTNVNGDGYTFSKVRTRSDRIPTIGDKFSCYTVDHEVLTTQGWVSIPELTMEHEVASLVGDKLVYQKPKEIQKHAYDGKLYNIETNHVSLMVTPNHRMYVKPRGAGPKGFRCKTAERIVNQIVCYKKNADVWEPPTDKRCDNFVYNEAGTPTHMRIPGVEKEPDEVHLAMEPWLIMFGIWIAEGCAPLSNGGAIFAAHKPRVWEALTIVCKEMNLRHTSYSDGHRDEDGEKIVNTWRLCDKRLLMFFHELAVGAINKRLPEWVWSLPREQCRTLIHGLCLGDGHTIKNTTTRRYDTSSTGLADDFQRLCLHAGWAANKQLKYAKGYRSTIKSTGQVITSNADAWRLSVITSQLEPVVNKNKKDQDKYIESKNYAKHDGFVYCCTVPEGQGVIYVRRNGKSLLSGNSRHGQKGTVGMVYSQEDMPFTKDGLVPDIIMNPHAVPSRMTIGQLMECIMGKSCVIDGTRGDGTPFTGVSVEKLADTLQGCGLERYGNEILYNSRTGEMMETEIFMGPTYYQRLKHLVQDKLHSRSNNGPVVMMTRQPAEGRARDGGLRLGEMEVECKWAHGCMQFTKERFMECSDNYRMFLCNQCGMAATAANPDKNIWLCKSCKNTTDFREIRIPYACKLLFQEAQTMNIATRFITE